MITMKKRLIYPLILIISISSLIFSACSSNSNSSSSTSQSSGNSAAIKASLASSEKADTYKLKGTISMKGTANGEDVDFTIDITGASSFDGQRASLSSDMGELLGGLTGSTDGFVVEQRIVNGVVYTKTPSFLGTQSPWIVQDYPEFVSDKSVGNQNPTRYLQYLQGIAEDVKKVGTETINNIETDHYAGTISAKKLRESYDSGEMKEYYENLGVEGEDYEQLKTALTTEDVPLDVWINKDDKYISRISMTLTSGDDLIGDTGGNIDLGGFEFTISMDFSDWGTDLDVTAPPESETMTQEEYQNSLKNSLSDFSL